MNTQQNPYQPFYQQYSPQPPFQYTNPPFYHAGPPHINYFQPQVHLTVLPQAQRPVLREFRKPADSDFKSHSDHIQQNRDTDQHRYRPYKDNNHHVKNTFVRHHTDSNHQYKPQKHVIAQNNTLIEHKVKNCMYTYLPSFKIKLRL